MDTANKIIKEIQQNYNIKLLKFRTHYSQGLKR